MCDSDDGLSDDGYYNQEGGSMDTSEDLNLTKSIKVAPTYGRKLPVDWIQNKNSIILVYVILYELRNGLMECVVP